MSVIVSKFGGSSAANAAQFQRILSIVLESPARRGIVLSAPGIDAAHAEKVTAMLERCWQLRSQPELLSGAIRDVVDRFSKIARQLSVFDVEALCQIEITRALYLSRAHTLSRGEYLCARIFSEYSGIPMLDAAEVITFDAAGRLDGSRTLRQIHDAISTRNRPFVLPGFYGSDSSGRIAIFPRNGSDITGALIAVGMDAGLYENWTDVPGLMSADPAIVPHARLIPQISYRQMRQLARAGAQVLHPACLDPVAMAGIPTRLRCSGDPENYGTLIDDHCGAIAPCLAGRRSAVLPPACPEEKEASCLSVFGVKTGDVLDAAKRLEPLTVERGRDCVRIYVERAGYEHSLRALHRMLLE